MFELIGAYSGPPTARSQFTFEQQLAGVRGGVDALVQDDEVDAKGLELVRDLAQVPRAPGQPVEPDSGHGIDLTAPNRGQEAVECPRG